MNREQTNRETRERRPQRLRFRRRTSPKKTVGLSRRLFSTRDERNLDLTGGMV